MFGNHVDRCAKIYVVDTIRDTTHDLLEKDNHLDVYWEYECVSEYAPVCLLDTLGNIKVSLKNISHPMCYAGGDVGYWQALDVGPDVRCLATRGNMSISILCRCSAYIFPAF